MEIIRYNPERSDKELVDILRAAKIGTKYYGNGGVWMKLSDNPDAKNWTQIL